MNVQPCILFQYLARELVGADLCVYFHFPGGISPFATPNLLKEGRVCVLCCPETEVGGIRRLQNYCQVVRKNNS
jgi:hypothetical protein